MSCLPVEQVKTKLVDLGFEPLVFMKREKSSCEDYCDDDDFINYDYAVIYRNGEAYFEKYAEWYEWLRDNNTECILFQEEGCYNGISFLVKEINDSDGAVVVLDEFQLVK